MCEHIFVNFQHQEISCKFCKISLYNYSLQQHDKKFLNQKSNVVDSHTSSALCTTLSSDIIAKEEGSVLCRTESYPHLSHFTQSTKKNIGQIMFAKREN